MIRNAAEKTGGKKKINPEKKPKILYRKMSRQTDENPHHASFYGPVLRT
jgi:hypothetical protein